MPRRAVAAGAPTVALTLNRKGVDELRALDPTKWATLVDLVGAAMHRRPPDSYPPTEEPAVTHHRTRDAVRQSIAARFPGFRRAGAHDLREPSKAPKAPRTRDAVRRRIAASRGRDVDSRHATPTLPL